MWQTMIHELNFYYSRYTLITYNFIGTENNASVSAVFTKATDEDNNGVSPGDDQYNTVYYYIVGECA